MLVVRSLATGDAAYGSVTRSQPALETRTNPGNWGLSAIDDLIWKERSSKRTHGYALCGPLQDGTAADQAVGGVMAHQTCNRYGP